MSSIAGIIAVLFSFHLNILSASTSTPTPRVKNGQHFITRQLLGQHSHTVFLHGFQNDTLYVGGHNKLFYLDFSSRNQSNEVNLTISKEPCKTSPCSYDITIMHANKSLIFVCGTNGDTPTCCNMDKNQLGICNDAFKSEGIAPFSVNDSVPSLFVGDDLYSTANRYSNGNNVGIRRFRDRKGDVWSAVPKTEQKYIGLVLSKRLEDELHDKIYSFLQEKNGDQHPEADPWIARVTQVCRTDMGGSKVMLQKQWTSILSARLTCGFPTERLYFNRLLDIFVLHADNWRESKVYGLFSSRWNSTAVCIYSMEDIDRVFTTSKIKGYSGTIPTPRPGTCVRDSTTLSKEVLDIIKDNPEMEDWVKPIDKTAPFMVSHKHYRKIQVDRVMGQNNTSHTVLLLSADNGVVHEVLQVNGRPFIIEEIQPFKEKTHIQSMILNPTTKKLYVGSVNEVVQIDLQSCKHYGKTCQDCVLAQNPYCGWNGSECTSATEWTIQDVNNGQHTVCQQSSTEAQKAPNVHKVLARSSVQEESLSPSYYLSCPVLSNNAQYFWQHKGSTIECQLVNGECVYLMKEKTKDKAGEYICRALEKGYEKQVVQYSVKFTNRATALHSSSAVLASILPFAALYF